MVLRGGRAQPRLQSNAPEAYHIAVSATTRYHGDTYPNVVPSEGGFYTLACLPRRWLSRLAPAAVGIAMIACSSGLSDDPVAVVTLQLDRKVVPLGGPVKMAIQFVVSPDLKPLEEDLWVMVHFLDVNGDMMWAADHEPSVPTSQWQPGQTISYTRRERIPMYPYVGDSIVTVGLYSPATGERWALTGDSIGEKAYRATSVAIAPQAESSFVYYQDGWHGNETDPETKVMWRWTTEKASFSFRNPRSDAVFYLELSGRFDYFETPQEVEIRIGEQVIYEIRLDSLENQFHEIPLGVAQLGDADSVTIDLYVDQTFVPESVSGGLSADLRSLGARVFYAFLEPLSP